MGKSKNRQALEFVREQARQCETATDLHNVFFGNGGMFGRMFSTRAEREAFLKTPEYEEIVEIRDALENEGNGAIRTKARQALTFVREQAKHCGSSRDLHNVFFGNGGKFGQLFPTRAEREAFMLTPEYEEIVRIRESIDKRKKRTSPKR
jgi:hypothetical protein